MSNLPISSKYRSTPQRPVDDHERSELNRRLNEAFSRGELSQDEYSELLDQLYQARTLGELAPVAERARIRPVANQPAIVATQGGVPGQLSETTGGLQLARWAIGGSVGLALLLVLLVVVLL